MGDPNEMVMVVPSNQLYFITEGKNVIAKKLDAMCEYRRRGDVETDNTFKQIIPYLVLWDKAPHTQDSKVYVTHRVSAGDERLRGKYSLGAGGHIRQPETIMEGMARELKEEVGLEYDDVYFYLEGMIMSDATEVDRVHMGLVYSVYGMNGLPADLKCLEPELEGEWMTLDQIAKIYDNLETWSQFVFDGMRK